MSQPSPKSSFLQTLLLMMVIFLGMQLMCRPPAPDPRPNEEILKSMRKINLDYSKTPTPDAVGKLNEEYGHLQRKLAEDKQAKPEAKEEMMAEAQVLLADVQLKDG